MSEQKIKKLVRERDGYKCVKCHITQEEHKKKYKRGLNVHRLIPGCVYELVNCVTMCYACHKRDDTRISGPERQPGPYRREFGVVPGLG